MFKNITIFKFDPFSATGRLLAGTALSNEILAPTIVDPDATQWNSSGFSSPAGFGGERTVLDFDTWCLFNVQVRERILPGGVIRAKLAERIAGVEARQGHKPSRKDVMSLKDEVVAELLPSAFIRSTDILCMVRNGYLVIGTSSARMADIALHNLRETYPADILDLWAISYEYDPSLWLTYLLLEQSTESGRFNIGEAASLRGADKSVARFKGMDMSEANVQDCLAAGMRPFEVRVMYDGIQFTLTDQFGIKGLKFGADLHAPVGSAAEEFPTTAILVSDGLMSMFKCLLSELPLTPRAQGEEL